MGLGPCLRYGLLSLSSSQTAIIKDLYILLAMGHGGQSPDWESDNLALDSYFPTINQLWDPQC